MNEKTLRDEIAIAALPAILAHYEDLPAFAAAASNAYRYADAMLAEREKSADAVQDCA